MDSTTPPAWPLAILAGTAGALCALAAGLSAPAWARRIAAHALNAMPDTHADFGGED